MPSGGQNEPQARQVDTVSPHIDYQAVKNILNCFNPIGTRIQFINQSIDKSIIVIVVFVLYTETGLKLFGILYVEWAKWAD